MIWQAHKKCYLPIVDPQKKLIFSEYTPQTKLILNRYNILEPENSVKIFPEKLDLVILPLVGFDKSGYRLGIGGGYYDRTFGNISKKPFLLGLGFEIQHLPQLPHDDWDVRLNGVLTDTQVYYFNP